jgi:beta-glucosidase
MKKVLTAIFTVLFVFSCSNEKSGEPLYLNPKAPVEERVEDLLSRMTLEEKVGQMCQFVDIKRLVEAEKKYTLEEIQGGDQHAFYPGYNSNDIIEMTKRGEIGSFLQVVSPGEANELQGYAMESRLKIPLIIGTDAIHGHGMATGTTVFPSPITLASSFEPELLTKIGKVTAEEMRIMGSQWTFSPNLDVVRDPRWGRTGETFGEDPYLVSVMGVALINGYQGEDDDRSDNVIACAKHLAGGGEPVNGINGAPMDVSLRTLREVYLPPFERAVKEAKVRTIMMAHNEIAGIPCHMSSFLMEEFLREENGFDGFIVSDWTDIARLHNTHFVAEDLKEAYYLSVINGIDMHMHGPGFYEGVLELVEEGRLTEKQIDKNVRRILTSKFELGLFEDTFLEEEGYKQKVFLPESRQLALDAARESMVLLKNDGILPLEAGEYKNIFVVGPNADNQTLNGDWVKEQPEEHQITILEGISLIAGNNARIFTMTSPENHILEASEKFYLDMQKNAAKADLIIVAVGENSLRFTGPKRRTCGENYDRTDLLLPGYQNTMVEKLMGTGKPVVVVLVNGRPLGLEYIHENANAIIESWEPGIVGGQAIAEILFGKINPSGKLPITVPRNVGQIQSPYNQKPSHYFRKFVFTPSTPLYEFGYGLSYTRFNFSEPELDRTKIGTEETANLSIEVTNTGKMEGREVIQLYIRDDFSSVTRPIKELKAFKKINLMPDEMKKVSFTITPEMLAFYDINNNYLVEPGTFTLMVGNSSSDRDLQKVKLTIE